MTINSTIRKAGPYAGTGSQTAFPFTFKVFATSDVLVVRTDASGNETPLALNTDYTVALNADQNANPGGTVTLKAAPLAGYKVTVGSSVPATQGQSIPNMGGFYPKVVEDGLDRTTILLQQLLEQVSRTVQFAFSDTAGGNLLPTAPVRANNLLGFDSNGKLIAVTPSAQSANALSASLAGSNSAALLGFVISQNVTINVPGDYPSISAVMAMLQGRLILSTARVTIQVANGTLAPTGTTVLNHINGGQIDIIGNRASPTSCVIQPAGAASFDLFTVSSGYQFGTIAGLYFGLAAKAGGTTNYTAVLSMGGGSFVNVEDCQSNNWYYAYSARSGARMQTTRCTAANAGDVAFWAYAGGMLKAASCSVSSAADTVNSLGFGFMGEFGGVVEAVNCSATGCNMSGFDARTNGTGRYYSCTSNGNTGSGFSARSGGKVEADVNSTSTNNGRYGVEVSEDAGVYGLSSANNTGNALGQANAFAYLSQAAGQAQVASSSGPLRVDAAGSNSTYFNTGGGLQAEARHIDGASAHVYFQGGGTSTAGQPTVGVDGAANDIPMRHQSKGAGSHFFRTGSGLMAEVFDTNGATDWLGFTGGAGEGRVQGTGASAVCHIRLAPKGAGGSVKIDNLGNYANDAAAATGGVPLSGLYRNGSTLQVRTA